ncbi:lipid-A-disaccharide synthase [Terrihabitans soli]|uniref:Lipid-A-disaccharide synthase n=1 Tax=Terrihabitans soli TaxID=708113 RepID=A0A6S6QW87_9HYPH|nr:lipid-A-disaccharide synthase [Terrihabitans soli]BCJ90778.1 lipid-A-disaccharide synthase [Terrihabitans soli]
MSFPLDIFIVAGEHSGDQLGFKLIRALREETDISVRGVGGPLMAGEGVASLFPLEDIAVMGFSAVIARLPLLKRRIDETVAAILANPPDVLVIIDSPDFTHRVAKAVRKKLRRLPVVDYVSPSVWAWRSGRARKMRAYVDKVLALLPFEPDAHLRLGGPDCVYVGHPLIERLSELRPMQGERKPVANGVNLLVLPGSRGSVVRRHMPLFGEVLKRLGTANLAVTIPAVPKLADEISELASTWPLAPRLVSGEAEKFAAMRAANVALAASGTSTLELALSGVPLIGAYRVEPLANIVRHFVKIEAPHILLPNLVLGQRAIPEFVAGDARPERIAPALELLFGDTPQRRAQETALRALDERMKVEDAPSRLAAREILKLVRGI